MKKFKFLEERNETVFFTGKLMEIYIPKDYFTNKMASYYGDKIKTLALFNFIVYNDENDRRDTSGTLYTFQLPMDIMFHYQEKFTKDSIQGKFNGKYEVFVLKTGDVFVDSTTKEKNSTNTKNFVFRMNAGKMPDNIEYDDVLFTFLESLKLNSVNLGNPSVIYELIISELYRDKKDETVPFRIALNKNSNLSLYDYQTINIKELPAIKGTFQALMFENIKQSVLYSILKTKNNEEEIKSPIEDVLKY